MDKAIVCFLSHLYAVTLFELTVVNDWYIIMVSDPQLPCVYSTDSLPAELDLPCHCCSLPLLTGDGPNTVTCCQTYFGPDCWVAFDLWHAVGRVLL